MDDTDDTASSIYDDLVDDRSAAIGMRMHRYHQHVPQRPTSGRSFSLHIQRRLPNERAPGPIRLTDGTTKDDKSKQGDKGMDGSRIKSIL